MKNTKYDWQNIPARVSYVAIDKRGDMFGYEEEPKCLANGIWAKRTGDSYFLDNVGPCENWKDSLEQRPEIVSIEKKYEVYPASGDYIKREISPSHFTLINRSYENFLKCYNDTTIPPSHLEGFIEFMVEAATPSLTLPQYIRLKIIECWKETFAEYPQVITRLEKIR